MEMEYVDLEELSHDGEGSRDPRTAEKGLTSAEAAKLLAQYGPNALPEKTKPKVCILIFEYSFYSILQAQLTNMSPSCSG